MLAFGNGELKDRPNIKKGMQVICPNCGELHTVVLGKDDKGRETNLLMFIKCGEDVYLVGAHGKYISLRSKE